MILLALACTGDAVDDTSVVTGPDSDCREQAPNQVVVSKPFDGAQTDWAVGSLDDLDQTMTLGRVFAGEVAWTPDGQVGAVALEDGTLGLWDRADVLTVLDGEWYASRVVADPSGRSFWIVDGNWPNNGGGLFRLDVDCDNRLGTAERVLTTKLATDLVFTERGPVLLATEVEGTTGDVHQLDADMSLVSSHIAFGYEGSSPSDAEVGPDGSVWVTDISLWGDEVNRVVALEPDLSVRFELEVRDPLDLVVGDRAVVLSGYEDEVLLVSLSGEVLSTAPSALPTSVVLHEGGVLVAENEALRLLSLDDLSEQARVSPAFTPGTVGSSPR